MEKHLAQLLEDIYALEPDLRKKDGEVRLLVQELLKTRPDITLDPAFISGLRARVLATPLRTATASPYQHSFSWWAIRLAPIGAFAAITLALIGGDYGPQPLPPQRTPDSWSTETAPAQMNPTMPATEPAGTMMKSAPVGSESRSDMMVTSEAVDSIFVADQDPGQNIVINTLMLSVPAYVRVFAYEDGAPRAVLGTSEVIYPGTHGGVPVALASPTYSGEMLYVQLFMSNGDAIFTPYEDAPLRDSAGNLIYATFMINSN